MSLPYQFKLMATTNGKLIKYQPINQYKERYDTVSNRKATIQTQPGTPPGTLQAAPRDLKNFITNTLTNPDSRSTLTSRQSAGIAKIIGCLLSIKTRIPHRYNMDIQSLRVGFFGGGGNVTALVENGGSWQTWIIVDASYVT